MEPSPLIIMVAGYTAIAMLWGRNTRLRKDQLIDLERELAAFEEQQRPENFKRHCDCVAEVERKRFIF